MKLGFLIYGSLDTLSGGYLYDRKLVEYLRAQGDTVEIISLPWRNYAAHLADNFRLPPNLDILIQDELNHPSLIRTNRKPRSYPIVSLVHHLRCSELRPRWQNNFYQVVEKKYLQSVDGFIFNSQTTQRVVNSVIGNKKTEGREIGNRKPSIIAYPPTDRLGEKITEDEIKTRAKQNPFRILFLGNVMKRKGLHILLNALFSLHPLSFILDIVGSLNVEPQYAQSMQNQVMVSGLSSVVHFHDALENEALADKFKQAHILVVPSSYEGFGIVYLEGMGFGLPAIGTTAGAASEIIADGETGHLIPPEDSAALAAHLSRLAADRDALAQMSINALDRYRQQPKWEQTAESIRVFLKSLIGGSGSRYGDD